MEMQGPVQWDLYSTMLHLTCDKLFKESVKATVTKWVDSSPAEWMLRVNKTNLVTDCFA